MLSVKSSIKSRISFFTLGVVIILFTVGAIYIMGSSTAVPSAIKIVEKSFAVRVYVAKKIDAIPRRVFYGNSVAQTSLELRSQVAGVVVEHMDNFITGSKVNKGEMIVRLDDFDYQNIKDVQVIAIDKNINTLSELEAKIKQAQMQAELEEEQLNIVKNDFARAKTLFESKIISQREVEVRQKALNSTKQSVNRTSYDLQTLKINARNIQNDIRRSQIELRKATKNIERTVIKAPFDAYIYNPRVEFGQQIAAGERIATLIDTNNADVEFTVSNSLYGRIISAGEEIVGRSVTIINSFGDYEIRYQAEIVTISPQASPQTGGIKVRAVIKDNRENKGKPRFNPGNFVKVRVPDRVFKGVFEVKQAALYEGNKIYSVDENNRLKEHKVEVNARQGDNVIITSYSIKNGMLIASNNFTEASEGVLVKIIE